MVFNRWLPPGDSPLRPAMHCGSALQNKTTLSGLHYGILHGIHALYHVTSTCLHIKHDIKDIAHTEGIEISLLLTVTVRLIAVPIFLSIEAGWTVGETPGSSFVL